MRWFGGSSQAWICIWAVYEFANGGFHKHSCALKSLPIQNTCFITNFLPTSLTTCLKPKVRNTFKVKWMKLWRNFFPTNACFLMRSIKWRWKQINKKKTVFVIKIYFEGMSVCRKCKHYPQGSFVSWRVTGYLLILK